MGLRYPTQVAGEDGWSPWIQPVMNGYRICCCDCGLVHAMQFKCTRVDEEKNGEWTDYEELPEDRYRVEFRVALAPRSTGQIRRHMRLKREGLYGT